MPEKIKNMYGIIDEKLLDYEDICNTYSELLEHEINKEQLNIKNIEEIALSFAYIFKIIYPRYTRLRNRRYREYYLRINYDSLFNRIGALVKIEFE